MPGRETTTAFRTIMEVLAEYSESDREFTFDSGGLPGVVKVALNRSKVTPAAAAADRSPLLADEFPDVVWVDLLRRRTSSSTYIKSG